MLVRFINLDRSPDRLARFRAVNDHLAEVQRVPAIDGAALDRGALAAGGLIDATLPYSAGALGVALTHLRLWQDCAGAGRPATVAEDDAMFNRGFDAAAPRLLAGLDGGWDIVLWGWNFDAELCFDLLPGISPCVGRFDPSLGGSAADGFRDQMLTPGLYRLWRAFGVPAYTVSPAGAAKLLAHCLPLRPGLVEFPDLGRSMPNLGIDIAMSAAYPALNAHVCVPPLVLTRNDPTRSTIQGGAPGLRPAGP